MNKKPGPAQIAGDLMHDGIIQPILAEICGGAAIGSTPFDSPSCNTDEMCYNRKNSFQGGILCA